MSNSDRIHIDLTTEQQDQIKQATGEAVQGLEFDIRELEQRIAPTEISLNYGQVKWTYTQQS